jgi:hypothetical protein
LCHFGLIKPEEQVILTTSPVASEDKNMFVDATFDMGKSISEHGLTPNLGTIFIENDISTLNMTPVHVVEEITGYELLLGVIISTKTNDIFSPNARHSSGFWVNTALGT